MPKTIIEVYFELLVTNFYAQISCSCHLKFHLHASYSQCCVCLDKFSCVNQNVLVSYMFRKLMAKIIAQLNFVQRLQIENQKYFSLRVIAIPLTILVTGSHKIRNTVITLMIFL